VSIPARSEMDVNTNIICRFWTEGNHVTQWSTEPTTVRSGVHVSGTVIPENRLNEIPVRIMNTTNEEVAFKRVLFYQSCNQ